MPWIKNDDCHDPHGDFACRTMYDLAMKMAKDKWDEGQNVGAPFSPAGIAYLDKWSDAHIGMRRNDWVRCVAENDLTIKEKWIRAHGAANPPDQHAFTRAVDCGVGSPEMEKIKGW